MLRHGGIVIRTALGIALLTDHTFATGERAVASLDWHRTDAAEECLDAPALAAAVEARLQRKVFVPSSQADIKIHVNLNSQEGNWIAAIDLENRNGSTLGHRELTISAQHCSGLEESLALMVSLMVDVTRESVEQPAPQVAPHARLETPRATAPTHSRSPWRSRAYLLGSLRDGQLPELGRGITLQGEISSAQDWSASLAVALWAPGQRGEEGLGARFWLGTVEADVCGAIRSSRSSDVSLCAGYQLGILDSRAFGFDVNQHKSTTIHDFVMRFRATFWATASFGFHGTLGVGLPLVQDEFFGTRTDGATVRLMSRPLLIPLADFGMAVRFDP